MGKTIALLGGGFKPPTKGHLLLVQESLKNFPEIDKFIIYVGSRIRDNITQEQSIKVWEIYKNYLPFKNLEILPSNSPIKDILDFSKNNLEDKIYFILGYREGRDDDLKDIENRTRGIENKYPNIEIKKIHTPNEGMSGTNARKALLNNDKDKFFKFLPSELSPQDQNKIYNILKKTLEEITNEEVKYWALYAHIFTKIKENPDEVYLRLRTLLKGEFREALEYFYRTYFKNNEVLIEENATYSNYIDYKEHIKNLTKFYLNKYPNLNILPKVKFIHGNKENAKDIKTTTAYYDPENMVIVLYTEGRHPRDIVASFSHEFKHHIQNLEGRLDNLTGNNTLEDDNLDKIEREAYEEGGITFRNYKDNIDKLFGLNTFINEIIKEENVPLEEGMYDSMTRQVQKDVFKKWKEDFNKKRKKSKFEEFYQFEDKKGRPLEFDLEANIKFKETEDQHYEVDGGAYLGDDETDSLIELSFQIDPRNLPKMWEDVYHNIGEVLHHEIEHLTQKGPNVRSGKSYNEIVDSVMRDMINKYKTLPQSKYYTLDAEIPAMLKGLYYKAKKTKTPFKQMVKKYLDLLPLKPEEKEEVYNTWKQHTKSLSLPVLQESISSVWTIYCDMDGVLTDFDGRFELFNDGISPSEYERGFGIDKFWDSISKVGVKFWEKIPWLKEGKKLWNYISKHNPILLSAPSRDHSSKVGKRKWVENNLPGVELILTQKENKKNYAYKSHVLIDDDEQNIKDWIEAGGIGILHRSFEETKEKLKKLGL